MPRNIIVANGTARDLTITVFAGFSEVSKRIPDDSGHGIQKRHAVGRFVSDSKTL